MILNPMMLKPGRAGRSDRSDRRPSTTAARPRCDSRMPSSAVLGRLEPANKSEAGEKPEAGTAFTEPTAPYSLDRKSSPAFFRWQNPVRMAFSDDKKKNQKEEENDSQEKETEILKEKTYRWANLERWDGWKTRMKKKQVWSLRRQTDFTFLPLKKTNRVHFISLTKTCTKRDDAMQNNKKILLHFTQCKKSGEHFFPS